MLQIRPQSESSVYTTFDARPVGGNLDHKCERQTYVGLSAASNRGHWHTHWHTISIHHHICNNRRLWLLWLPNTPNPSSTIVCKEPHQHAPPYRTWTMFPTNYHRFTDAATAPPPPSLSPPLQLSRLKHICACKERGKISKDPKSFVSWHKHALAIRKSFIARAQRSRITACAIRLK